MRIGSERIGKGVSQDILRSNFHDQILSLSVLIWRDTMTLGINTMTPEKIRDKSQNITVGRSSKVCDIMSQQTMTESMTYSRVSL
jgi:hypothetical protein